MIERPPMPQPVPHPMPWTPEHDLTLVACWVAGKPVIEIGHRLDRTVAEVGQRRRELNLPDRDHRARFVDACVEAVAS